ncbi:MAG: flavodoxin-dependent (E)-4-hydroxy-3-methylbut-2-enyl-diphosphate synthase [Candidatus Omnitrophica bacterium]|nr:flavodoxin-dependent (E)-4-hydroxy-3-methylbut-2-enyl-diphosphate synthase [Candidatus Omnitrophota bacterium]MDD5652781.1 flavodoxin-dependent (E)-4-hydroxy-3-methylbut-2-enyl-diphosphate synthase [Candidatus Omnitrophota bacterium]
MAKLFRRKARVVRIGALCIGGNHPVAIQSMVKFKTAHTAKVIAQIKELEKSGCEIVRLAVKDMDDARAFARIKPKVKMPLVADIHFDWRLGITAMENGADKIRLNPGNIFRKEEVVAVAKAAKKRKIPIRMGLNSGSLPKGGGQRGVPGRMVKSALDYIKILESCNFHDIVISLKASNIRDTVEAYRLMAKACDYPLHLGVTATGAPFCGAVKSAIAVGALLLEGIGDTIRISLTQEPQEEVKAAKSILEALELRNFGPQIISCPTCGRCEVDLVNVVKELESALRRTPYSVRAKPLKIAVMGCVVNGPGEAKEADLGIAFGKKEGLLFKHGKAIKKVTLRKSVSALLNQIN